MPHRSGVTASVTVTGLLQNCGDKVEQYRCDTYINMYMLGTVIATHLRSTLAREGSLLRGLLPREDGRLPAGGGAGRRLAAYASSTWPTAEAYPSTCLHTMSLHEH